MRYVALCHGEERQVEITELSPGQFTLVMDGRTLHVDARAVSETTLSLLCDDRAFNIESESNPSGGGQNVMVRGHIVGVEVIDLRTLSLRKAKEVAATPDGPMPVASPMAGKVVAVLVHEGQQVEAGQGLVVVEAMKMENEIRAPRPGVVTELHAQTGSTVDGGATLCMVV